jgi:DNA-binding NarL/FixJ family response regulator
LPAALAEPASSNRLLEEVFESPLDCLYLGQAISNAMNKISVCVLDDHPMIAEGIRRIIEHTSDILFSGSAENLRLLDEILAISPVDVAIFDVRIKGENVEHVCRSVKRRFPNIKIFILSSFFDRMILKRTFSAGASGYALKNMSLDNLPDAIRQIYSGNVYLSPEIMSEVVLHEKRASPEEQSLGRREELIIDMIADGRSNKEIAQFLGISPHTVKLYVSRLLKKYSYRNRSQLTRLLKT